MKKINLKESLLRIDRDTDFKHALTDLYEACRLENGDKRKLAQFIEDRDIPGMSNLLSNAAGVMMENISDDLPDDETELVENDTMSMYRVANLEDIDYIMSYEMPDCIVYGGDVEGEYKCAYHNGVSVNVKFNPDAPGYVYTIDGEGPYETRSSETVKSDITRALDRKGWNEAFPNGSPTDHMTVSGDEPLREEVNAQSLQSSVYQAATDKLRDMGYDEDFISDYFGVKVTDADNNCVRVTVWGELSYEETLELADILNPIVEKEDPQAYFDHDTSGRMSAYIRNDQSDDIPNEEQVAEWTDRFNNCKTWEELKVVYNEIVDSLNRDDLSGGTYSAIYSVIDRKIDELKPFEESLSEDAGFDDLDEGIFSIAGDAAGRGLVDLYKGVRNVAKGVRDVAKAGANDAKKMATDIKQSKVADKVRDAHRAVKNSDTVDDFKKDYKRRQDMRQKSDAKRDQVWKDEKGNERIGKSIGNKQDWVYVVDGKRMSYDEYKKIPSETRAKLSSEGKIQKFDLSGNHVTTNQNKKRLNAKDKVPNNNTPNSSVPKNNVPNNKAPNNNVPNNNAPNNNAPNNAPNTAPKNNVPNNKATNNKASNNNVPNNNVPNNAPKKVVPKKVVPKNKVPKNGVKESLLMEGPGAGYTIECDIVIDGFNGTPSIKRIELDKDPGATPGSYKVYLDCDGTGHVEGLEAHSYYYGDSFPGTYPVKISELLVSVSVVGDGDLREVVENSIEDILADLVGFTFTSKYTYGGGWSHSTYDGTITDTTNPLNDSYWGEDDAISFEVYGMDAKLTDNDIIDEIDMTVSGENEYEDVEESLTESIDVGSRVKQTWENPYNVGTVIDSRITPTEGLKLKVKWDYSDGEEVEWVNSDEVSPYNEEDEKAGFYESLTESTWDSSRVTELVKYYLDRSNVPDNMVVQLVMNQMKEEGKTLPYNITDFYDTVYSAIYKYNSGSIKEDWTHFTFKSGSNPYIAKDEKEKSRMLKKYGDKAKEVKSGFYEIDDTENDSTDLFKFDDELYPVNEAVRPSTGENVAVLMKNFADKANQFFKQDGQNYEAKYVKDVHRHGMGADVYHIVDIFSTGVEPTLMGEFKCGKSVGDWYEKYTIKSLGVDGNFRIVGSGTFYDSMIDEIEDFCFGCFDGFNFDSVRENKNVVNKSESINKIGNAPLTERVGPAHPEESKIADRLMSIPGTTKVEFDWANAEIYRVPENHLIMLVFCRDGFEEPYFENRRKWRASVLGKLRTMGWTLEDPVEDNDSYLYLVMKKRKAVEEAFVHPQFSGPWWYLCKHGIGPGAIPKGVTVVDTMDDEENPNRCYVALDKVLTTDELKRFEMKEARPPKKMDESSEKPMSFADMLKMNRAKNAEYEKRMAAKYEAEKAMAEEAKTWPNNKELTYEEAMALARAYYSQGGDSFYETTEKYQFEDEVKEFGPMTVGSLKRSFRSFDSVYRDRSKT